MADLKKLVAKYKNKSDIELETLRDEIEKTITGLREQFMELGVVADYRRQIANLDSDDIEKQIEALKAKKKLLEI